MPFSLKSTPNLHNEIIFFGTGHRDLQSQRRSPLPTHHLSSAIRRGRGCRAAAAACCCCRGESRRRGDDSTARSTTLAPSHDPARTHDLCGATAAAKCQNINFVRGRGLSQEPSRHFRWVGRNFFFRLYLPPRRALPYYVHRVCSHNQLTHR